MEKPVELPIISRTESYEKNEDGTPKHPALYSTAWVRPSQVVTIAGHYEDGREITYARFKTGDGFMSMPSIFDGVRVALTPSETADRLGWKYKEST